MLGSAEAAAVNGAARTAIQDGVHAVAGGALEPLLRVGDPERGREGLQQVWDVPIRHGLISSREDTRETSC